MPTEIYHHPHTENEGVDESGIVTGTKVKREQATKYSNQQEVAETHGNGNTYEDMYVTMLVKQKSSEASRLVRILIPLVPVETMEDMKIFLGSHQLMSNKHYLHQQQLYALQGKLKNHNRKRCVVQEMTQLCAHTEKKEYLQ